MPMQSPIRQGLIIQNQSGRINIWIVLSAIILITLVGVGLTITIIVQTSQKNQEISHRNAQRLSDQGIQEASMKLATDPKWRSGFPKTPYKDLDGWYTVTITNLTGEGRISLISEGHCQASIIRQIFTLRFESTPAGEPIWIRENMRQE